MVGAGVVGMFDAGSLELADEKQEFCASNVIGLGMPNSS
jgi:hypothetical protein